MRMFIFVAPAALALGLLSACGGCGHGGHHHETGQTWERAPEFEVTCSCTDEGVSCEDGQEARTSGGSVERS